MEIEVAGAKPAEDVIRVPFAKLWADPTNYRTNPLPAIPELAADIAKNGQIEPIGVEPTPDGPAPFAVTRGYRRHAAMVHLGWNRNLVLVRLQKDKGPLARIVRNVASNGHVKPHAADLARAVAQLAAGTYPVREGETAEPQSPGWIQSELGINPESYRKLVRCAQRIDPAVQEAARAAELPTRLFYALAAAEPAEQAAFVEAYVAFKKAAENGEAVAAPALGKRGKDAGSEDDKGEDEDGARGKNAKPAKEKKVTLAVRGMDSRGRTVADYAAALEFLATRKGARVGEKNKHKRTLEILRFFQGKASAREPLLTAKEFALWEKEQKRLAREKAKAEAQAAQAAALAAAKDTKAKASAEEEE